MFSQRNRKFEHFGHKEIGINRKIGKMKYKRHLTIFMEFWYFTILILVIFVNLFFHFVS